jgi:hypothetical protein
MLFSHKRTILFINKEEIRWIKGRMPDGKFYGQVQFLPWSEKNLSVALENIEQNFPKKIRLVVGEEFSYVTNFKKIDKKSSIISEAQVFIPEKLQDGWDSCERDSGNIQFMAVQQRLLIIIKKAFSERQLQIEAIEVESISIARIILAEKNEAFIFAKNESKIILGIAQNDEVLATRIFSIFPAKEEIEKFIEYVSKQKDISVTRAFVQDKTGNLVKIFADIDLDVKESELDPMLGICCKKDITGRDKDVLNILLNKHKSENVSCNEKKYLTKREKIIAIIFLMIVLGGVFAVYYIKKIRQNTVRIKQTVQIIQVEKNNQAGLVWEK